MTTQTTHHLLTRELSRYEQQLARITDNDEREELIDLIERVKLRIDAIEVPYCMECGSEDLAYIAQYANGEEWRCKVCGNEFLY